MRTMRSMSRGEIVLMWTDDPAPALERDFPIDLVVEIEIARPDHDRADVVRRAMKQQLLGLVARQAVIGIESGPARVGRGARAHIVGGLAAGVNVKAAHLEPVVAEAGLAQPASPGLDEGAEGAPPAACQFGLKASAARIVSAPSRWACLYVRSNSVAAPCPSNTLVVPKAW